MHNNIQTGNYVSFYHSNLLMNSLHLIIQAKPSFLHALLCHLCAFPQVIHLLWISFLPNLSSSLWVHRLWPARFLYPWDSPGKNTGVGSHFILQWIFPELGIKPGSPALQADSYHLSHQGNPFLSQPVQILLILQRSYQLYIPLWSFPQPPNIQVIQVMHQISLSLEFP